MTITLIWMKSMFRQALHPKQMSDGVEMLQYINIKKREKKVQPRPWRESNSRPSVY